MATVIGMTAARGEEIAAEHVESGAVVGSDLVLTRRNAEEIIIPGVGGGGAEPKWGIYTANLVDGHEVHTTGPWQGNSTIAPDHWVGGAPSYGGSIHPITAPGFQSTAGEFGWVYTEAGWYMVSIDFTAGFSANSDPLPKSVKFELSTWIGAYAETFMPVTDSIHYLGGTGNQVSGQLQLGPYYSFGSAEETNEQSAHQLYLIWQGDASLTGGSGGGPAHLQLSVIKIA